MFQTPHTSLGLAAVAIPTCPDSLLFAKGHSALLKELGDGAENSCGWGLVYGLDLGLKVRVQVWVSLEVGKNWVGI